MSNGIERVMARMNEIEDRIGQITGEPGGSQQASFAQALNTAQGAVESSGSPSLPPLPAPPDGRFVQPLPLPASSPTDSHEIGALAQQSAAKYGLSPNLLSAVIQVESGGDPRAVSKAGAMGLMQLMPSSVADADISDPFDPAQNIDAGARKLSGLLAEYGDNLDLALAAYNAGSGAVRKYGGVPPYKETQDYIRKVRKAMETE